MGIGEDVCIQRDFAALSLFQDIDSPSFSRGACVCVLPCGYVLSLSVSFFLWRASQTPIGQFNTRANTFTQKCILTKRSNAKAENNQLFIPGARNQHGTRRQIDFDVRLPVSSISVFHSGPAPHWLGFRVRLPARSAFASRLPQSQPEV